MAAMYASTVNLSSGQIFFGDPTKVWSRANLPSLPIPNLTITAAGTQESASFPTLVFSNAITYKPYEPSTIFANLEKPLTVDISGNITYKTLSVGFVSTTNTTFQNGITGFTSESLHGPNIQDITQSTPDTITNALAKIDNWLKQAFLVQPPAVIPAQNLASSVYGGVRWLTFPTYSILNSTMPSVTSILFVIGDPTGDNLTFEWNDPAYFPLQNYANGISPVLTPVVRLRIFTDFFPLEGDVSFTKQALDGTCFRLLNNSGACALPNSGRVFFIQNTDHTLTYTTFNVYLPNLTTTYPKGSNFPVNIVYMNKTATPYNVTYTSTMITTDGGPSAPVFYVSTVGQSTATYTITPPTFSDTLHNVTESYISSYFIANFFGELRTAFDSNSGFYYGVPNISTLPSSFSTFVQATPFGFYIGNNIPFYASTLTTVQSLLPAAIWIPGMSATNLGGISGELTGLLSNIQYASTLFTSTNVNSLSTAQLTGVNPFITTSTFAFTYGSGSWSVSSNMQIPIAFISSPTQVAVATVVQAQLNDASYPGDRNSINVLMTYADISATLQLNPVNDDYTLNSTYTTGAPSDVSVVIKDTDTTYGHLFYKTNITALPLVSTINNASSNVQLTLQNTAIQSASEVPVTNVSATYGFGTEAVGIFNYTSATYLNRATNLTYVSGILTPNSNSDLVYTAIQSNQFVTLVGSTIGSVQLLKDITSTSGLAYYTSTLVLLQSGTPVTTTPFPQNTLLEFSSLTAPVGLSYQDPTNPVPYNIVSVLNPPFPQGSTQTQTINIPQTIFMDTVSVYAQSSFNSPTGTYGKRVLSFIPRRDIHTSNNNIQDTVSTTGAAGIGLQVAYSTFIQVQSSFTTTLSTALNYNNNSTLLNSYPSPYNRELMMTGGLWTNPCYLQFNNFAATALGDSTYMYPNFIADHTSDPNKGYRYATFLYSQTPSVPTFYRYANVTLWNPSIVSTVTSPTLNPCFPNTPVDNGFLQYATTKLNLKMFASFEQNGYKAVETAWTNGFKYVDNLFDDSVYDIGACMSVSTMTNAVTYKLSVTPRYYTNIAALVRVGISRDRNAATTKYVNFSGATIDFVAD